MRYPSAYGVPAARGRGARRRRARARCCFLCCWPAWSPRAGRGQQGRRCRTAPRRVPAAASASASRTAGRGGRCCNGCRAAPATAARRAPSAAPCTRRPLSLSIRSTPPAAVMVMTSAVAQSVGSCHRLYCATKIYLVNSVLRLRRQSSLDNVRV